MDSATEIYHQHLRIEILFLIINLLFGIIYLILES